MKVLLVQIGSVGDCLLVTTIAKQIKEKDYPGCHLTWMIGDRFKEILNNNPHVDEIIEIPLDYTDESIIKARKNIPITIEKLKQKGEIFDKVIITDCCSVNEHQFWGTFRSIYFRIYQEIYGHKITISPEPVIYLSEQEILNVKNFISKHDLDKEDCYPILFECSPKSKQSNMTFEKAFEVSKKIVQRHPNVKIILSSKEKFTENYPNIIDGSVLTFRENAELLNHCKLLVGSNSGITWLNASTWSKKIPMVQHVKKYEEYLVSISASVELDYKYFGESTDDLIELLSPDDETFYNCISDVIENSVRLAKCKYKESEITVSDYMYKMYQARKYPFLQEVKRKEFFKIYLFNFIPIISVKDYLHKIKIRFLGLPILKIK